SIESRDFDSDGRRVIRKADRSFHDKFGLLAVLATQLIQQAVHGVGGRLIHLAAASELSLFLKDAHEFARGGTVSLLRAFTLQRGECFWPMRFVAGHD